MIILLQVKQIISDRRINVSSQTPLVWKQIDGRDISAG